MIFILFYFIFYSMKQGVNNGSFVIRQKCVCRKNRELLYFHFIARAVAGLSSPGLLRNEPDGSYFYEDCHFCPCQILNGS